MASMTSRNSWTLAFSKLHVEPRGAVRHSPLGKLDTRTLPSLRGERSPKGVNGGMTAEEDKARRLKRQQAKRSSERRRAAKVMPSEYQEQQAVCEWWAIYAAAHKLDERLLMAIPNGAHLAGDGRMRAIQMTKLKATGLRPSAPDLLLAKPAMIPTSVFLAYHGLFIEMKRLDGKLSADQHSFGMLLQSQGYAWTVAKGAKEAIRAISAYLGDQPTAQNAI